MATQRQSRTVPASTDEVWELVSDPHHLPRWWPGVVRVEDVTGEHFTEVFISKRGRTVRQDYRILASEAPRHMAWAQELEGTPFASFLSESRVEVELEADGGETRVTLEMVQKPKGQARFGGGFQIRRATRDRVDEALNGLADIVGRDADASSG